MPAESEHRSVYVTAVLVTHDGGRWLPQVLPALFEQLAPWQRLVVADTGSLDGSVEQVRDWVDDADIVRCPRTSGFGAAVKAAIARADASSQVPENAVEWIWLLHDDAEPEPDALAHLLANTLDDPNRAVLGPKLRAWYHRRVLLEVGVTVDGGGRRETGIEIGEEDQGQHDHRSQTLAVSSAGMLIRRDVWDSLGGFDPHLQLLRDDVDLCWRAWLAGFKVAVVPAAVVYHAEAAYRERRDVDVGSGRVHHLDRAGALRVLLANLSTRAFVVAWPRLLLGSLLRAVGYLVAKLPGHAADELRAVWSVLIRPRAIRRMRRARRAHHQVAPTTLRRLFPPPGHQFEVAREALTHALDGFRVDRDAIGKHRAGPADGDVDVAELDRSAGGVLLRRVGRSPAAVLVLGLLGISLLASRRLFGDGSLFGGAMLPLVDGSRGLLGSYVDGWHAVGAGSGSTAAPAQALLALAALPLFGNVSLLIAILFVGAVPLAGLSAWLSARGLPTTPALRFWGAAAYALSPALVGAVAAGRLGAVVAIVLLPPLLRSVVRAWAGGGTPRAAWTAALLLVVIAAFAPLLWLFVSTAAVVLAAFVRDRTRLVRIGTVPLVPFLLLVPFSLFWIRHPDRLLLDLGPAGPGLSDPEIQPWRLLLLNPAGPGSGPAWIGIGVVAAGIVGLIVARDRLTVLLGWTVAGGALVVALLASRVSVAAPSGGHPAAAWPGPALALATAGMLVAALVGCAGQAERLVARDFGRVQLVAGSLAAVALLSPVLGASAWLWRGADGPLHRASAALVPVHVAAESATADRSRTLVLRSSTGDSLAAVPAGSVPPAVSYALVRDAGPRFGDAELSVPRPTARVLQALAIDLVSGRGDAQAQRLADFAVRYVVVRAPVAPQVAAALDAVPGLERVSAVGGDRLWRVSLPTGRLRVLEEARTVAVLPSGAVAASAAVPDGSEKRILALAEPAGRRWEARLNGVKLSTLTREGWAQAWTLPPQGGELTVRHVDRTTPAWAFLQGCGLLVLVVLALPAARRRSSDEDEDAVPVVPAARRRARIEEPV
ncbi:MAG: glycosyltransferase [Sporichthyaceae bacterium]